MYMRNYVLAIIFVFYGLGIQAQDVEIYPTNWWVGMQDPKVQLMIRYNNIGNLATKFKESTNLDLADGIILKKVHTVENPNYLFLDLEIKADAKPGIKTFTLNEEGLKKKIQYELKPRRSGMGTNYAKGISSEDLVYLIMPDRFSNGDESNDKFTDLNDSESDRKNPFLRHGGDLRGVMNHFDYLKKLGVTAIWFTPVIENNQALTDEGGVKRSSYHGYGFTNQYKIDKRYGGNEMYKKFIDSAHSNGLKVVQDAVYNHVGNKHFLFLDQPSKDWFNVWPEYTNTSYKDQPLLDPYASTYDYEHSVSGWFTPFLPDLNQKNPFVEQYLIQHAVWTVEEFGIDGWRVDTYFYSDRDFLNKVNERLYTEFPQISIFGETWVTTVTEQAYFSANNIKTEWKSNLKGVTDFTWYFATLSALNENFGWSEGVNKLYSTLIQDILYKYPMNNVLFLDNHDLDRFYSVVGEDFKKYKMGISLLLTQRGIPQLYYGTEILMKNFKNPSDAEVRRDFPGGFKNDSTNKFNATGRTSLENEAFDFVSTLANFRKNSSAIKTGNFMQFLPADGVYVYFRYDEKQTVMCILNSTNQEKEFDLNRYTERIKQFSAGKNILTGEVYPKESKGFIPANETLILELIQ